MTYSEISTAVAKLIKKYDERDPFRLCRAMGIKLIFQPMGTAPDAVKGFFLEKNRIRVIVINSDLPEIIQRIIGAHELCHAEFHRKSGIHAFHEVAMFDQTSEFEKDANLFAAELLLEDGEVLSRSRPRCVSILCRPREPAFSTSAPRNSRSCGILA